MEKSIASVMLLLFFVFAFSNYKINAQSKVCGVFDQNCKIAEYTRLISVNPKNTEAFLARAFLYENQADYDQAIEDFTVFITLGLGTPDQMVKAYTQRAVCYTLKDIRYKAILDYTSAINLEPKNPLLFFKRGDLYKARGAYDRAIADFTTAITLKPDYVQALRFRGNAFLWLEKRKEAFSDFNRAIEIDPNEADAYFSRAYVYSYRKEYLKAISDYDRFLALNSRFPWTLSAAYNRRGIAYQNLGNSEQAIKDISTSIELSPDDPSLYLSRSSIYRKQGKNSLADADEKLAAKVR